MAGKSQQPSHKPPFQAPVNTEWTSGRKERGRVGGGTRTTVARKPFKSHPWKNQLLEETPNALRLLKKPAAWAARRHNCYLKHKHAETKLERAMWACTWSSERWPRKTPAKLMAVNFVKYHLTLLKPEIIWTLVYSFCRLAYKLTHLYYNWPGTVRVPAPCQVC